MHITPSSRHPRLPSHLLLSTLLLGSSLALMGQDVEFIVVLKEQRYGQFDEHIVALLDEDSVDIYEAPFFSEIGVDTPDPSQITSIMVTLPPSGPVLPLPPNGDADGFEAVGGYELLAEMNAEIPNGSYLFNFDTVNDGMKSVSLNLTGDNYPSLTKFTGFAATKSINAAVDKTFTWDVISGGSTSDWVFFEIEDETGEIVFETPGPGEPTALDGTSVSATVPGGVLSAGTSYTATLFLIRPVDLNEDYASGVTAVAAYGKSIELEIRTTGNSGEFMVPQLDNVAPNYGQGEVETNSIVTFIFNEPMNTGVDESQAITWTGVANPGLFQYTWSPDGHRLFCKYASDLPTSATIGWQLNPFGSATKLRDVEGNQLNTDQFNGDFFTKGTSNFGVPDVKGIQLLRGHFYEQNSPGAATLLDYFAEIYIDLNGVSTVSSVDLLTPGLGSSTNIGEFQFDHLEIEGEALFAEEADLKFIFPNGTYNLTVHTAHDGDQTVALDLSSSAYPNAPVIQNFAATQAWDSTQALTVEWNAMTGGTSTDLIVFFVEGDNACFFETPEIGVVGALDGTATSVTIPANTLPPGRTLEGGLAFIKVLTNDTTQYPGVISFSGIATVTEIQFQTTGDPIKPTVNIVHGGDAATLFVTGEKGRVYQVNSSPDLETWTPGNWIWLDGEDCNGFLGTGQLYDFNGVGIPSRYFQLEEVSND